ncbi:hypothetical protein [Nocardia thailandica]
MPILSGRVRHPAAPAWAGCAAMVEDRRAQLAAEAGRRLAALTTED